MHLKASSKILGSSNSKVARFISVNSLPRLIFAVPRFSSFKGPNISRTTLFPPLSSKTKFGFLKGRARSSLIPTPKYFSATLLKDEFGSLKSVTSFLIGFRKLS